MTTLETLSPVRAPLLGHGAALLAGLLFGVGLGLSGMTLPSKVLGFLDVTGHWDPSLMLVMVGAIGVHAALYRVIRRRRSPLFDDVFHVPTSRVLDGKLVGGALLFGVGWGLGGFCPGPALVSLATGHTGPLVFLGAMLLGMGLQRAVGGRPAPSGPLTEAPDSSFR